jgi:hypothetical protein
MIDYQQEYVSAQDKWIVDLRDVDFITMKQNWDDNNFHIKMHIGTKEVRFILEQQEEVDKLIKQWKEYR